jgi:hypothetical protein
MKKILALLLILSGCTPVQYVMVDAKDSTKLVEVRKRIIYEDIYQPSVPLYFYNGFFGVQPYRPLIIQRPIVIPRRPVVHHNRNYVQPLRPSRIYSRPLPSRPPRKN